MTSSIQNSKSISWKLFSCFFIRFVLIHIMLIRLTSHLQDVEYRRCIHNAVKILILLVLVWSNKFDIFYEIQKIMHWITHIRFLLKDFQVFGVWLLSSSICVCKNSLIIKSSQVLNKKAFMGVLNLTVLNILWDILLFWKERL